MTRFARAAGSKSSNQRVPEDSTPWFVLKQQVTENKKGPEETNENETDWKNVIDSEKKIEENKNSVWCEFEEEKPKTSIKKKNNSVSMITGKPKPAENVSISSVPTKKGKKKSKISSENLNSTNDNVKSDLKNIKSKLNLFNNRSTFQEEEFDQSKTEDTSVRNGSKPSFDISDFSSSFNDCNEQSKNESIGKNSSLKKKKRKRKFSESQNVEQLHNSSEVHPAEIEGSEHSKIKHENELSGTSENNKVHPNKNNTITRKNKNKKENPYKRRKLDEGDVKLEINGQEIWVTRLDGFYIKKEDAERIRQLEKDLLKRGVSKQEVRAVIKKERRNAEKALARQKKKVCYHCRKGGHTLSACPMLEDNGAQVVGSGICYKCGSTEHTHFQCKVNTGNSYKFATCFVCKQEGHISKQCPDNPRGVYPSGGGCRLCGDVTHFRRECPTLQAKSNKVTVGLIDEDIENLDGQPNVPTSKESANKRKNKIVKFS